PSPHHHDHRSLDRMLLGAEPSSPGKRTPKRTWGIRRQGPNAGPRGGTAASAPQIRIEVLREGRNTVRIATRVASVIGATALSTAAMGATAFADSLDNDGLN